MWHRKHPWLWKRLRKLNGCFKGRFERSIERVSLVLVFRLMTWPEVRMSLAHSFLSQGHRTTSGNKIHSKDDWLRQVTEWFDLCIILTTANYSSGGNEHALGPASSSMDGSSVSIQALLRHDHQRLSSQCQCLPGWFPANIDERCRNRVDQLTVSQPLDPFASSISRCSPLQDTMVAINTSSYAECSERCGTCLYRSGLGQFPSKELIDQTIWHSSIAVVF